MDTSHPIDVKNRLLRELPVEDLDRILSMLEPVKLSEGQIVYRPNEPIDHIYFPHSATISVVAITSGGERHEIAVIGDDGVAGLAALLNAYSTPYKNIVQFPGHAYRMQTTDARTEFDRNGAFQQVILHFAQRFFAQINHRSPRDPDPETPGQA